MPTSNPSQSKSILKRADEEHYTLGVVYEPDTVDSQGHFADAATIRKACFDFNATLQGRSPLAKALGDLMSKMDAAGERCATLQVPLKLWDELSQALSPGGEMMVEKGMLGIQHGEWDDGLGMIVESYIAPVDMTVGNEPVKSGAWLMGVIWSNSVWAKIKAGEITGYSLGGYANPEQDVSLID